MADQQQTLTILEACKERHASRNYDNAKWTPEKQALAEQIVAEVNKITPPFGTAAEIAVHPAGLGRLGFVSGEGGWILLKIPADKVGTEEFDKCAIDAAFKAHIAVMKFTQNHIDTVWIGGTFNEKLAEENTPGFNIPVVVAFGAAKEDKRIMDHVISWVGPAKGRKAFNTFFYNKETEKMVEEADAGKYLDFLMAVRQCPTSFNAQTIRLTLDGGNKFTLFNAGDKPHTYEDMGIGLGLIYFFADGKVTFDITPEEVTFPTGGKYICKIAIDDSVFA